MKRKDGQLEQLELELEKIGKLLRVFAYLVKSNQQLQTRECIDITDETVSINVGEGMLKNYKKCSKSWDNVIYLS